MNHSRKVSIILIILILLPSVALGCTENSKAPETGNEDNNKNGTNNQGNETENGPSSEDFLKIKNYNVTEGDYFIYRVVQRKSGTIKKGRFTVSIHNVTNTTYDIHYMGYGELFSMGGPEIRHKNITDPVFREDIIKKGVYNGKKNIKISNDTITLNKYIDRTDTEDLKMVTTAFFHPEIQIPILYYYKDSKGKRIDVEAVETNLKALNQTLN